MRAVCIVTSDIFHRHAFTWGFMHDEDDVVVLRQCYMQHAACPSFLRAAGHPGNPTALVQLCYPTMPDLSHDSDLSGGRGCCSALLHVMHTGASVQSMRQTGGFATRHQLQRALRHVLPNHAHVANLLHDPILLLRSCPTPATIRPYPTSPHPTATTLTAATAATTARWPAGLTPSLKKLLTSDVPGKVGVNISGDAQKLRRDFDVSDLGWFWVMKAVAGPCSQTTHASNGCSFIHT